MADSREKGKTVINEDNWLCVMLMILTTTGCYGTGSSAITDIVKEFGGVTCKGDLEIRILHDPDGVSDLEYNLVENPNRHNSSQSIKRFKKRMKELDHILFIPRFRRYFGNDFLNVVEIYINKITADKYKGTWHYDVYDKGKLFYIYSRLYSKAAEILSKVTHRYFNPIDPFLKKEEAYLTISDEKSFCLATREFIDRLVELININHNDYVFMDQLVPPSNFKRYLRYIPKTKIVLVERDPRDIYLLEKLIWKGRVAPTQNVDEFCEWYKWTRNLYEKEVFPPEVILIQFEDLIYKYEETRKRIMNHFSLTQDMCKEQKQYFNPNISISNTRLWMKIPGYEKEINFIEKHLEKYCYDYSRISFDEKEVANYIF